MAQWLNVSRAAQLIGTRRTTLQRMIRAGELPSFEGMVASDDLQRLFPELRLESHGDLERVTQIKESAFARRVRERILPNQETLALRLTAQGEELAQARRELAQYQALMGKLQERIADLVRQPGNHAVQEIAHILDGGLEEIHASASPPDPIAVADHLLRIMSAHVTVRPSGHEFFVDGDESLLDAALRAGLAPAYGCGSGNCGLCKARLVSGTVRQIRPSDCALSAQERAQGYTLLCTHTAVSDVVIEMLEARLPADLPEQHLVAQVKSITPLHENLLQLHVQTPRSQRLRFFAGQQVTLGLSTELGDLRIELPLASCPCDDRNLRFHIRRGEASFASRLFAGALNKGDAVSLWGPFGDFVLPPEECPPLFFLACDTGYAPMASLIEHALAADRFEQLELIWAATEGHYLDNQCRAWANALDNFRYRPLSCASITAASEVAVAELVGSPVPDKGEIYVAGPTAFVSAASDRLALAGVPRDRVHTLVC